MQSNLIRELFGTVDKGDERNPKNLFSRAPTVCPAAVVGAHTGGRQRETGGQSTQGNVTTVIALWEAAGDHRRSPR